MNAPYTSSTRSPLIAIGVASALFILVFGLWIRQRLAQDEREDSAPVARTGASAAPGSKADRCRICEEQQCSAVFAGCSSAQCTAVLACVRKNQCADAAHDTLVPCYCGDVVQDDCFLAKAQPKGACRSAIEAGMGTTNALDIGQRYFDTNYEAGKAFQLVNCDMARCKDCL